MLMRQEGVKRVFMTTDYVTVTKTEDVEVRGGLTCLSLT